MTYRVGIVGSGFGGSVHAPAFMLHRAFEVLAIASPVNASRVAQQRGIPYAFDSLEALLATIEVDVISVASPPFDHHASVMRALAAGKHVLCEKPFALNVAQGKTMVDAAAVAGTACAIAHEFRYTPAAKSLHALIESARIVGLRQIELTRFGCELRATTERERSSWWFSRTLGGGAANAFLPHLIDLAHWYAGRSPVRIAGFGRTANPARRDAAGPFPSEVYDGVFVLFDYGGGLVARVTTDSTTSMDQVTIALHAESMSVVASGTDLLDMRLFTVEPDEQSELELAPLIHAKFASVAPDVPPFLALLDDFAQRIATGGGHAPTFEDGLRVQLALAAIGYKA